MACPPIKEHAGYNILFFVLLNVGGLCLRNYPRVCGLCWLRPRVLGGPNEVCVFDPDRICPPTTPDQKWRDCSYSNIPKRYFKDKKNIILSSCIFACPNEPAKPPKLHFAHHQSEPFLYPAGNIGCPWQQSGLANPDHAVWVGSNKDQVDSKKAFVWA